MIKPQDWEALRFLAGRFIRPYWKTILGLAMLNVLVGALVSLRPLVMAPALDAFIGTKSVPATGLADINLNNLGATLLAAMNATSGDILKTGMVVAVLYLIVSGLIASLGFTTFVANQRTRSAIARDMMTSLHRHLLALPLAYFHRNRSGDLVSRVAHDANSAAAFMDGIVRGLLQSLARVAITLAILVNTDALFTLSIVVVGAIHIAITRFLGDRVRDTAKGVFQKLGVLNARLVESFSNIRLVKSFAAEAHEARHVGETAETLRQHQIRFWTARQADEPLRIIADAVVVAAILLLAFYAITQGRLTPQAAVMFFYLVQQVIGPVSDIAKQLLSVQQMVGGASRMLETFRARSEVTDGTREAVAIKDGIQLLGVNFSYEPGRPMLKGIDFEIKRGEMIAVVGPSGAGKSTLADLILRFYDPDQGVIRYDGVDIREFRQDSYRRNFGVVSQECLLFNATVRENIVYNRDEDADTLAHAAWVANASEFIAKLPQGLDTFVGDRGVRLSGGQRQRLAIARAVYSRPAILLLDEATSALDTESERAVQEAVDRIAQEMTAIVIAHRLSTILHADRIVVMNDGRIEAVGPHAVVLEISPTYRRLYRLQYAVEETPPGVMAG